MGRDIHMSIVNNGEYIDKEIFDGRNSDWFDNLCGTGWDNVYDSLPVEYGIYEKAPEEAKENYEENYFFDFRYIKIRDMLEWLQHKQPWKDAGWASAYEKWNYEFRGMAPEEGFPHYKPEDKNEEYYFITYEKKYECSKWLYIFLMDKYKILYYDFSVESIPEDDYLIYYFDA